MVSIPVYLDAAFILTTALTVGLLLWAAAWNRTLLVGSLLWLLAQAALSHSGFYTVTDTLPPRFALVLGPPLLVLITLFVTAWGRRFLDALCLPRLTLLHMVRVPVELVLFGLYLHLAVPRLMTFEGRNWDIVMGLTAPLIYYRAFRHQQMGRTGLFVWNVLGLVLLGNIVLLSLLSAPSPFQQLSFARPNVAMIRFPYVWLPAFVVPVVLLVHLAALRQLILQRPNVGSKS